VLATLSTKAVMREKTLEFKKQLVSNKGLREYFSEHAEEKEILMNDIMKMKKCRTDMTLFKSLDIIPSYLVPDSIMFTTEEEMADTTIGVNLAKLPEAHKKDIPGMSVNNLLSHMKLKWVEPDNPSSLVQNLVGFPGAVERYKAKGGDSNAFNKEEPLQTSF